MTAAATAAPVRRQIHPPPVAASPFPYNPGSLLSVQNLTLDAVSHLLSRASVLENMDPLVRDRILLKRRVALLPKKLARSDKGRGFLELPAHDIAPVRAY